MRLNRLVSGDRVRRKLTSVTVLLVAFLVGLLLGRIGGLEKRSNQLVANQLFDEASITEISPSLSVGAEESGLMVLGRRLPKFLPIGDLTMSHGGIANEAFGAQHFPVERGDLMGSADKQPYLSQSGSDRLFVEMVELLTYLRSRPEVESLSFESLVGDLSREFPGRDLSRVEKWLVESASPSADIADGLRLMADNQGALRWYQRAERETGCRDHTFQVGAAYLLGCGTKINLAKGRERLFRAMRDDHAEAAYLIGVSYLGIAASEPNTKHAYRLFQRAIGEGSQFAYAEAGRMRELGVGVEYDLERAIELFTEGAKRGDRYCLKRLALLDAALVQDLEVASHVEVGAELLWIKEAARSLLLPGFLN